MLPREMGVKMCDNTLRNVLREQGLSSFTKVKKHALSRKNIKDKFRFAQMHKDWTVSDGSGWCLVMKLKYIVSIQMGGVGVG